MQGLYQVWFAEVEPYLRLAYSNRALQTLVMHLRKPQGNRVAHQLHLSGQKDRILDQ